MKLGSDYSTYRALYRYTKALSVALGYRDLYTRVHSDRVLAICLAIAARMNLSQQELGILRISATFHDIGKIGIPDRILLKPGQLDADETEEMQQHSAIGAEIVASTELDGASLAALMIRHHHEYWNGGGYPDGLSRDAIPLCARIIGVADSYDAMATRRAYHPAKAHDEIMEILDRETGVKHDPRVIDAFRPIVESALNHSSLEL